jgi:hypothetical protein
MRFSRALATLPGRLMVFQQWLRRNAEHYLLVAAQDRVGLRYGAPRPRPPAGTKELLWMRLFAPVYARVPWPVRSKVLHLLPGSHRQQWTAWTQPPHRRDPAV